MFRMSPPLLSEQEGYAAPEAEPAAAHDGCPAVSAVRFSSGDGETPHKLLAS